MFFRRLLLTAGLLCASSQYSFAQESFPPATTLKTIPVSPAGQLQLPPPLAINPPGNNSQDYAGAVQLPFSNLPSITLSPEDNLGIAQSTAHAKKLQGRILWVDATANLDRCNTDQKIKNLVAQAKTAGFNEIVVDVKPIIGYTTYPSKFTSKLATWRDAKLPQDFDPLDSFIKAGHEAGLQVCANLAVFSEGHKYFNAGLGYNHPSMQTIMYKAQRTFIAPIANSPVFNVDERTNTLVSGPGAVTLITDNSVIRKPISGGLVFATDFMGRIVAQIDGSLLPSVTVAAPAQGAIFAAQGKSAEDLKAMTHVGDILRFQSDPKYIPIGSDIDQKITLFVNPNDPDVQQHELDIVQEIVQNYPVDGIIFDDRLRFAAINADFSALSQKQFEAYLGHSIKWPDDVFAYNPYPNQDIIKGPYFEAWQVWRALTIRNWLAKARATVKYYRPDATVSVYAGSWYDDYGDLGENWAADDYNGDFDFNTDAWKKTGFAGQLDWMTTGCYYAPASIAEGKTYNTPGATVEAAGQLSKAAVNDQTWVYAGIYALMFDHDKDGFAKALQAAAASTQGIMIFDVSQLYSGGLWPVITDAFNTPATAPHQVQGLLDTVRQEHNAKRNPQVDGGGAPPPTGSHGTGL
jgi:uncharacterized lipoprotein YddW (UPF0748 family)